MSHSNRPEGTLTAACKCPEGGWREDGARGWAQTGVCISDRNKTLPLLLLEEFRGKESLEELP